jgi:hypothetical protein
MTMKSALLLFVVFTAAASCGGCAKAKKYGPLLLGLPGLPATLAESSFPRFLDRQHVAADRA